MSQRLERVAGEVRAVLGEVLARDEIKDPRVRGVGLITVTHVRVSGDLAPRARCCSRCTGSTSPRSSACAPGSITRAATSATPSRAACARRSRPP